VTDSIVVEDPEITGEAELKNDADKTEQELETPEVPDKFKGKSPLEIIEMYQHLESDYGRRANEVGHLRKLTDELLGFARVATDKRPDNRQAPKPITADDLINDPQGTITNEAKRVADERAQESEARVARLEVVLQEERFEKRHPGYKAKMEDGDFINWVGASEYRKNLAMKAYNNDFSAADELFSLHEEYEKAQKAATAGDSKAAARAAGLAKSGGSSAAGVTPKSNGDGKKTYSRTELIELRIKNPEEFDRRWETEFHPAYQEGRVR